MGDLAETQRFCGKLAYDGTNYFGFQRQAKRLPSIQSDVEAAVLKITGQNVTVLGAGRTDTGVHATGQIVTFDVTWNFEDAALLRALNAVLPDAIAFQAMTRVDKSTRFHPRFSAVSRLYKYTMAHTFFRQPLLRHRTWRVWGKLDKEAMQYAASLLIGTHDCAAFGLPPQGENTVRTIYRSKWESREEDDCELWVYSIEGSAFLHHMVRRIVGMMMDIGRGFYTVDDFEQKFRSAKLVTHGTMAPPHGLVLTQVRFPENLAPFNELVTGQQAGETPAGGKE